MITIKTRDTVVRIIRGKPPGRPFALTPAQEREMIRRHMLNGEKMVDLCKAYGGISTQTFRNIRKRVNLASFTPTKPAATDAPAPKPAPTEAGEAA